MIWGFSQILSNLSFWPTLICQARRTIQHLRGAVKFEALIQDHMAREQTATTLSYIHSWSRIQDQIKARRFCMITEAKIKQRKLENQFKLEAKLHELEVVLPSRACHFTFLISTVFRTVSTIIALALFYFFIKYGFWQMCIRWNGAVVLKQWRRYFPGYISEKKQQLNESEPWHMPSLIKY